MWGRIMLLHHLSLHYRFKSSRPKKKYFLTPQHDFKSVIKHWIFFYELNSYELFLFSPVIKSLTAFQPSKDWKHYTISITADKESHFHRTFSCESDGERGGGKHLYTTLDGVCFWRQREGGKVALYWWETAWMTHCSATPLTSTIALFLWRGTICDPGSP